MASHTWTPLFDPVCQVGSCVLTERVIAPKAQPWVTAWHPELHSGRSDLIVPVIWFDYAFAFPNSLTLYFAIHHRAATAAGLQLLSEYMLCKAACECCTASKQIFVQALSSWPKCKQGQRQVQKWEEPGAKSCCRFRGRLMSYCTNSV